MTACDMRIGYNSFSLIVGEGSMTYVRTYNSEGAMLSLHDASKHVGIAMAHMQQIVNDNLDHEPADSYTLRLIDNLDLLRIYMYCIESIAKEI